MSTKAERLEMLGELLDRYGVELGSSDQAIQDLNDWFYDHVEADPDHPGLMLPIWCSVVHDIALFLGDAMIERHRNLRWGFFTWGKTSVDYQQEVILGFATEDPQFHTNMNLIQAVAMYGHRIVASRGSVPTLGVVEVRGTPVDLDAIAESHRGREVSRDDFVSWMRMAARRNGEVGE